MKVLEGEITSRNLIKSLKNEAKWFFNNFSDPSCVCIAIDIPYNKHQRKNGRLIENRVLKYYVGLSGKEGRKVLLDELRKQPIVIDKYTFKNECDKYSTPKKHVNCISNFNKSHLEIVLHSIADNVVDFRSKERGRAIEKRESWTTHNCAESNLYAYLLLNGKMSHRNRYSIASFEKSSNNIDFKAPCSNCIQWIRDYFDVIEEYNRSY
jgi:cytidine deaminase